MSDVALVVDDSLTVRMDISEAFQAAGFTVVACATLAEAREAFARSSPSVSVVVLDVILPDGDGVAFLAKRR